ncbi:unnamed protein product [Cylicostephanus goldi]|uniref:Uncharacterized protein n=1 Tax=Cylicostephanus goldi TaxID=71465 RepID=A0A3P6SBI4_CYLGO|nr:unnamed protein product [Cylicostephanus goldi]
MLGNLYVWPGQYYAQSLVDFLRPHGQIPANNLYGLLGPFDTTPTREMLPVGGGFYFILQKMEWVQALPYASIFAMIDSIVL